MGVDAHWVRLLLVTGCCSGICSGGELGYHSSGRYFDLKRRLAACTVAGIKIDPTKEQGHGAESELSTLSGAHRQSNHCVGKSRVLLGTSPGHRLKRLDWPSMTGQGSQSGED